MVLGPIAARSASAVGAPLALRGGTRASRTALCSCCTLRASSAAFARMDPSRRPLSGSGLQPNVQQPQPQQPQQQPPAADTWRCSAASGSGAAAAGGASSAAAGGASSAAAAASTPPPPLQQQARGPTPVPLKLVVQEAVRRWFEDTLSEAQRGDVKQQALLAQMYAEGYGCTRDARAAREWAEKARARGYRMSGVYCEL